MDYFIVNFTQKQQNSFPLYLSPFEINFVVFTDNDCWKCSWVHTVMSMESDLFLRKYCQPKDHVHPNFMLGLVCCAQKFLKILKIILYELWMVGYSKIFTFQEHYSENVILNSHILHQFSQMDDLSIFKSEKFSLYKMVIYHPQLLPINPIRCKTLFQMVLIRTT